MVPKRCQNSTVQERWNKFHLLNLCSSTCSKTSSSPLSQKQQKISERKEKPQTSLRNSGLNGKDCVSRNSITNHLHCSAIECQRPCWTYLHFSMSIATNYWWSTLLVFSSTLCKFIHKQHCCCKCNFTLEGGIYMYSPWMVTLEPHTDQWCTCAIDYNHVSLFSTYRLYMYRCVC